MDATDLPLAHFIADQAACREATAGRDCRCQRGAAPATRALGAGRRGAIALRGSRRRLVVAPESERASERCPCSSAPQPAHRKTEDIIAGGAARPHAAARQRWRRPAVRTARSCAGRATRRRRRDRRTRARRRRSGFLNPDGPQVRAAAAAAADKDGFGDADGTLDTVTGMSNGVDAAAV